MKAIAITDVGKKRSMNQDYVFMSKEPVGNLPNLFIVADGMGGHKAGDFASRYAVAAMTESIGCSDETNPVKLLRSAIEQANREIIEKAGSSPEYEGMGTTLVAACIMHGYTYIARRGRQPAVCHQPGGDPTGDKRPFAGRGNGPDGRDPQRKKPDSIRIRTSLREPSGQNMM